MSKTGLGSSEVRPRIEVCGHAQYSAALVMGVRFCLCRMCGHRWSEWPL